MYRDNVEAKEIPHWPVIGSTLCSLHSSSDLEIMDALHVGDGIVTQMPLLAPGKHPCGFVLVCQSEECVGDD